MPHAAIIPDGSLALRASFVALALLVAGLFVAGVYWSALRAGFSRDIVRRQTLIAAVGTAVWLAANAVAAAAGLLQFAPRPTMVAVFVATFALTAAIASSPLGRRLAIDIPLAALVGAQTFRALVEVILHRAYIEGLMPVQMSYSGRNFDIVTGLTAILVSVWLARGRSAPWLVLAWNTLGLGLLLNILGVALLSAPTPLRVFMNEPSNVWITRAPWVWLPSVMVLLALMGHVIVYRRLWIQWRRPVLAPLALNPRH